MLLKINEQFGRQKNLSLPQKGIVVDNRDPKGLGRIKATVGGLLEGTRAQLPWILPWVASGQGGSAGKTSIPIPDVGDVIAVEFKFNDIYSPFYTGHWQSSLTRSGADYADYPKTQVVSDESGNIEITNREKKTWEKTFASGAKIKVDAEGNISFTTKGKISFNSDDGETEIVYDMQSGESSNKSGETTKLSGRKASIESQEFVVNVENKTEAVTGSKVSNIDGSHINSIGGSYSQVVAGNSSKAVSGQSEDLYTQQVKNTYGLGKQDDIVLGNYVQNLIAGNIDVNLTLGNETHTLTAGNYGVNVAAGNITLQTLLGNFTIGSGASSLAIDQTGNVTIVAATNYSVTSSAAMNLTAGANMSLTAPIIQLNGGVGQVLTNITSPVVDTITGIPTIGNPTVLA